MLNDLAKKAIFPVALTVTGFVVVCCILLYTFIQGDLIADTIHHETNLANTIVKSTRYAMLKDDRETLGQMIANIGEQEGVEHVRIFNKKGLIMFSADPSEVNRLVDKKTAGCVECHSGQQPNIRLGTMEKARQFLNAQGRDVLAITMPIYNEPGCSTSACHAHPPLQKILGTLDIGVSQEPLNKSLSNLRLRMVVFCLMVLALTVGGVSALLRRNVLIPVGKLALYADALRRGESQTHPPKGPEEVERIAQTLKELSERGAAEPVNRPEADR